MQLPPMRPTFSVSSPLTVEEALDRLAKPKPSGPGDIHSRVAGKHLMLVIAPDRRHFWSPWLNIEVDPNGEGSTIHARFSPNPSVWTAFMLGYIALATLIFLAAMFGVAQWMMDRPPSSLLAIPVLCLVAMVMYWASMVGQKLAQAQMHELHDAAMNALAGGESVPTHTPGNSAPRRAV